MSAPPPIFMGDMDQYMRDKASFELAQERHRNLPPLGTLGSFLGTGQQPLMEVNRGYGEGRGDGKDVYGRPVGIGMLQQGRMGPLSGLGQYINQELEQQNQGEVDEFIGEVGNMANQRFGVDLGSVGQRPMFMAGGGAAFPDLSGDGKITQKDILMGRGVIPKQYGGPIGMQAGGDLFTAVTGVSMAKLQDLPIEEQQRLLAVFKERLQNQQTPAEALSGSLQNLERDTAVQEQRAVNLSQNVDARSQQIEELNRKMKMLEEGVQGMQMGGSPMMAPPMPMPPPEAAPPMEAAAPQEQLDPNVVQQALSQAAGGIASLDEAQNYEDVMNSMRGDQASVEQRRQELAGVVGPGDAGQTPESVLTLVQPVMMLANVDQGVGGLAQEEMTQPMEGPMAEGIMSTVPEPPMMEADGTVPVNFKYGGEVRPVQYFAPENSRVAGENPFANLAGTELNPFVQQAYKARQALLSDPAELGRQKDLTKAQILFDIAQTALAFSAPMPGEKAGLSPAERLALAASTSKLPQTIGARAKALGDTEAAQKAQDRAVMLSAITSGEAGLTAKKAADQTAALQAMKGDQALTLAEKKAALERSTLNYKSALEQNKSIAVNRALYREKENLATLNSAFKLREENFKAKSKEEQIVLKAELDAERDRLNAMDAAYRKKKSEQHSRAMLLLKTKLEKDLIALRGDETMRSVNAKILAKEKLAQINSDLKITELGVKNGYDISLLDKKHEQATEINKTNNALKEKLAEARNKIAENELKLKGDKFKLDQEKLELDQTTASEKAQIERETLELKQEEFELEKAAKGMLDIPGVEGAYVGWLENNISQAEKYANGETSGPENNTIELVLNNFTAPKSVWSPELAKYVEKPGGKLSDAWQKAIKKRLENFGVAKSLPLSMQKETKVKLPDLKLENGEVNFVDFEGKDTFIINGVDLSKATGFRAGLDNFLNYVFGQVKDISGFGTGYAGLRGKEVSVANEQLSRLATSVISVSRKAIQGKVFKLDLDLLEQDVNKFKPGGTKLDARARDSLVATRNKLAMGYNNLIGIINDSDNYSSTTVANARENKEAVESLLGELTAAIASFNKGLSGSNVGAAETQTFKPLYLTPRNNQEEGLFP